MDPATEDGDLLLAWQAGDGTAGEHLVERYFDRLYRFFHTKLEAEADELVQATFLACVAAKDRFRRESSFRTFLYGIARNQLYSALRGRAKMARFDFAVSSVAEVVSSARSRLAKNQEYERLGDAMRMLPVEQQTLLELHYWDELGMTELAAVFETTEVNIRTRLHRARKALRGVLEREAEEADDTALESMDNWARSFSGFRVR